MLQTYLVGWVGERALQDLRIRIFTHLQEMSIGFFTRNRPGVLISRITNDVDALDQLISSGVVTLFSSTLTLVGVVVIMLVADVQLALVVFLTLPLLAIASLVFRIVAASAYRITRERIAEVTAYLQETLSGVRVVRSFAQERRHVGRMAELNELNRQANLKTVYLNASYFPAVELLSAIGTAVILLYGGYQALDLAPSGERRSGSSSRSSATSPPSSTRSSSSRNLYTTYQQGMAALDKIFDLLDTEPDMVDKPGRAGPRDAARRDRDATGLVLVRTGQDGRTEALEWTDRDRSRRGGGDAAWALEDISIHVPAGETLALVGETGAGKSTFAKLVSRFYDPQRGAVLVDGNDLRDLSSTCLRSQLGIVPQEGFLFSGTVRENIAFGRPDASDEEIEAAADGDRRRGVHRAHARRVRDGGRRARRGAVGRAAAADRVRQGAAGRAADPDPRRGDLERRRADRADDRAGAGAAARGPDGDRDRAPALDDSAARNGSRCSSTGRSSRAARTTS